MLRGANITWSRNIVVNLFMPISYSEAENPRIYLSQTSKKLNLKIMRYFLQTGIILAYMYNVHMYHIIVI